MVLHEMGDLPAAVVAYQAAAAAFNAVAAAAPAGKLRFAGGASSVLATHHTSERTAQIIEKP